MTNVFEKYSLPNGLNLRNRIVLTPLDMQLSRQNGLITERDLNFHRSRSRYIGMDIVGSAFVSKAGNTAANSVSVAEDATIAGLARLADVIHENGAKAILQLVHAGRATTLEATQGAALVAPSAINVPGSDSPVPEALTTESAKTVIDDFVDATVRAKKAGFDGVELHGANGFLLQQFVSPASNHRNDDYGGSLARRLRFPIEVVAKIQQVINGFDRPFALGYRLSPVEMTTDGLSLVETVSLAKVLEAFGVTYLSLSLLNFEQRSEVDSKVSNRPDALLFKDMVGCPLMIAGGITTVKHLEAAGELADLIGVGTALIKNSNWPKKIRNELNVNSIRNTRGI